MKAERGQATVEVALVLPLLVMLAMAVVWVGIVVAHQLAVVDAARAGARTAATGADDGAVLATAAGAAPGLDPARLDVVVVRDAGRVTVHVRYRDEAPLAALDRFVPSVELSDEESEVDERDEPSQTLPTRTDITNSRGRDSP